MWPFTRKINSSVPSVLYFKNGQGFFEYQCRFGFTNIEKNKGIVAIVLDAAKEFGVSQAIRIEENGTQLAMIKIISEDGGFIIPAQTPSSKGDILKPDDIVIWVPSVYDTDIGKKFGDERCGWVGFIRAKVAPEIDTTSSELKILCEYN